MPTRSCTTLSLICTSHEIEPVALESGTIALGRHRENDIRLEDGIASRFHCVVESSSRGYVLRDLGSRNGTRLNGTKIQRVVLNDGDEIGAGKFTFKVSLDGNPGQQNARLPDNEPEPARAQPAEDPVDYFAAEDAGGDIPLAGEDPQEHTPAKGTKRARSAKRQRASDKERPQGGDPAWADRARETISALSSGTGASIRAEVTLVNADGTDSTALEGRNPGPSLARLLLILAARARATDIHLEPKRDFISVRVRIDGSMVHIVELPPAVGEAGMSLFRTACQFPQTKRDAVLDGHFGSKTGGRRVDYRASFTPTVHGTKLVLRVLDPRSSPQSLNELRMPTHVHRAI